MISGVSTDNLTQLWDDFTKHKDEKARENLLIHYLPLVKYIAGRMKVNLPGSVILDDLVSAGLIGLINSIDNFNIKRGVKFETFAAARIRGAILDGLRDVDWLPRSYRQKNRRLDQAMDKLTSSLERIPTDEEIAAELGMGIDEYLSYIENVGATSLVSMDVRISTSSESDVGSFHDLLPDNSNLNPFENVEYSNIRDTALKLIDELSPQERDVVALYYYEELTFREIGEVLGISESRICQIHTRTISILRARLRELLE